MLHLIVKHFILVYCVYHMDALCVVNPFKGGTENEQYNHGKVHIPLEICGLLNYNCQYSTLREQHLLRFLLTFNVQFPTLDLQV